MPRLIREVGADAVKDTAYRPTATCAICNPARSTVDGVGLCWQHRQRWQTWGSPDLREWVAAFLGKRLNACCICGTTWNGRPGATVCSGAACKRERVRIEAAIRYDSLSPEERKALNAATTARQAARRAARLASYK